MKVSMKVCKSGIFGLMLIANISLAETESSVKAASEKVSIAAMAQHEDTTETSTSESMKKQAYSPHCILRVLFLDRRPYMERKDLNCYQ